jgi:hypothetical protein
MYIFTLVDGVQKIIEVLREEHGDFTLAMLYNSGPLQAGSSWNLIVSAPWTDEMGVAEATRVIVQALSKGLEFQDKGAISRVTVLPTSDPFVKDMNDLYPSTRPAARTTVPQVSGGQVTEGSGFILYSHALNKPSALPSM